MSNIEKALDIRTKKLDENSFKVLFELSQNYKWIISSESRENAICELYSNSVEFNSSELILHLIDKFTYVDEYAFEVAKTNIANKFLEWKTDDSKVLICAIADGDEPDGSQALLQFLKNAEVISDNFSPSQLLNKITAPLIEISGRRIRKKRTIILVDDFIGSSKTICRKIDWLRSNIFALGLLNKVDIYVCSLACMQKAKNNIDFYIHSGMIKGFHSEYVLQRGISDYFEGPQLSANIDKMVYFESKLAKRIKHLWLSQYSLGFRKSEALFSWFSQNIPNNVFPIFWWNRWLNGSKRKTLFGRII